MEALDKMRVLMLCGDHLRHDYVIEFVARHFEICGVIRQMRESMVLACPNTLLSKDRENYERHFEDRKVAEVQYFGKPIVPEVPTLKVNANTLNSFDSIRFVNKLKPDMALVFGTGIIDEPLLKVLPRFTINLHLGLSPQYRGAATLFWPFYFLEPSWAGATFHFLVHEPDAGSIVHQVRPPLYPEDGIHDVGCRTVLSASESAVRVLSKLNSTGELISKSQRGSGKNFLARDFRAQHLRVIYQLYDNDIVRAYLSGELEVREPVLCEQPGC